MKKSGNFPLLESCSLLLTSIGFVIIAISIYNYRVSHVDVNTSLGFLSQLPFLFYIGIFLIAFSICIAIIYKIELGLLYSSFILALIIYTTPQLVSSFPIINDSYFHTYTMFGVPEFVQREGIFVYLNFPLAFLTTYYSVFQFSDIPLYLKMEYFYLVAVIFNLVLVLYFFFKLSLNRNLEIYFLIFVMTNFYFLFHFSPLAFTFGIFSIAILTMNIKLVENDKILLTKEKILDFLVLTIFFCFLALSQPTWTVIFGIILVNYFLLNLMNFSLKNLLISKHRIDLQKSLSLLVLLILILISIFGLLSLFAPDLILSMVRMLTQSNPLENAQKYIIFILQNRLNLDRFGSIIKLIWIIILIISLISYILFFNENNISKEWLAAILFGSLEFLFLDVTFFTWGENNNRIIFLWTLIGAFCLGKHIEVSTRVFNSLELNFLSRIVNYFSKPQFKYPISYFIIVTFITSLLIGTYQDYGLNIYTQSELESYEYLKSNRNPFQSGTHALVEIKGRLNHPFLLLEDFFKNYEFNKNIIIVSQVPEFRNQFYTEDDILKSLSSDEKVYILPKVILLSYKSVLIAKLFRVRERYRILVNYIEREYSLIYDNQYQRIFYFTRSEDPIIIFE